MNVYNTSECPCCGEVGNIQRRRINTRYVEDERNFLTSCELCYNDIQDYWAERWEAYWGNVL